MVNPEEEKQKQEIADAQTQKKMIVKAQTQASEKSSARPERELSNSNSSLERKEIEQQLVKMGMQWLHAAGLGSFVNTSAFLLGTLSMGGVLLGSHLAPQARDMAAQAQHAIVAIGEQMTGRATAKEISEVKQAVLETLQAQQRMFQEGKESSVQAAQDFQETKKGLYKLIEVLPHAGARIPSIAIGIRGGAQITTTENMLFPFPTSRQNSVEGSTSERRFTSSFADMLIQKVRIKPVIEVYFDYRIPLWTPSGFTEMNSFERKENGEEKK